MKQFCNYINTIASSTCNKVYFYIIIVPFKGISSMFSLCLRPSNSESLFKDKDKISDEKLNNVKELVNGKHILKKKASFSNLNEEFKEFIDKNEIETIKAENKFNSKLILNIEDRTPFIKSKSKIELQERMEFVEKCMYIKCKYCGREVNNSDIYLIYDNHYCSEICRWRMLNKK